MPKKSRKPRSRKEPRIPVRVKFFVSFLVILIIAGIGAVKFLKTTRGMALLLDGGFTVYYDQVQEDVGKRLLDVLGDFGVKEQLREKVEIRTVAGKPCYFMRWDVSCGEARDLVQLNLALTRAVHKVGLRVRESEESEGGDVLRFDVGTRRHITHRIFIRKGKFPPTVEKAPTAKLALVIDDFGYTKNDLIEEILTLDVPLTISVIPSLPYSNYTASLAKKNGKEVLLHLPMEPVEPYESDIEMVLTSMKDHRIRELVEDYLREIPQASGVNNHMGSLATQDERVMRAVISVLKKRGLFFLDSLTSSKSVAYTTAKSMGVKAAMNTLFLDADTRDPAVIEERLHRLVSIAKHQGYAVGIAHPKPWTFGVLQRSTAMLEQSGVQFVVMSEIAEL